MPLLAALAFSAVSRLPSSPLLRAGYAPFASAVDYGDGSGSLPGTVWGMTCTGPVHTNAVVGSYTVVVAVSDKDGGTGTASAVHAVYFAFSRFFAPVDNPLNCFGGRFWPVVTAQILRHTALRENVLQHLDHGFGRQSVSHFDRQALPCELVYQGQELWRPTVRGGIEHKVISPEAHSFDPPHHPRQRGHGTG